MALRLETSAVSCRWVAGGALAAVARALDLTLVTADARLLAGSGFEVLANR